MHAQGCISAEKYLELRNIQNDAPPFPHVAVANHEINTGSQVFGACFEVCEICQFIMKVTNLLVLFEKYST
jgi:hypothetical protein